MLRCRLCGFQSTFRFTMDDHLRKSHGRDNPLDMLRHFEDQGTTMMGLKDDEISIPDPEVINSGYSGGGGDFGGGGASSDY